MRVAVAIIVLLGVAMTVVYVLHSGGDREATVVPYEVAPDAGVERVGQTIAAIPRGATPDAARLAKEAERLRESVRGIDEGDAAKKLEQVRRSRNALALARNESVPALKALLADPHRDVQIHALEILPMVGTTESLSLLVEQVTGDGAENGGDPTLQLKALECLRDFPLGAGVSRQDVLKMGVPACVAALQAADRQVRDAALNTLNSIGNTTFEYDPAAEPSGQKAQRQAIRDWLAEEL